MDGRIQASKKLVPELFHYRDELGNLIEVDEKSWLYMWLSKALGGAFTGFKVIFYLPPADAPVYQFRGCSRRPSNRLSAGRIWIRSDGLFEINSQTFSNQKFLDSWFVFFAEVSNLMAAGKFETIDHAAANGAVSEMQYCRSMIQIEIEAANRGVVLFDAIIGPLREKIYTGEQDQRSTWAHSLHASPEGLDHGQMNIDESDGRFTDHFRYYREVFREIRSSVRRAGDKGE